MSAMNTKKVTGILDVSPEVLTYIFTFCHSKDIQNAALSCRWFYECSLSDYLWRLKASREFHVTNLHRKNWTYRYLYWHLLYKYGHTIGIWRSADAEDCFGALMKIEFDADTCSIKGYEMCVPPLPPTTRPLRRKLVFDIRADRKPGRKIRCCYDFTDTHYGCIQQTDCGFKFQCEQDEAVHGYIHFPIRVWLQQTYDLNQEEVTDVLLQFGSVARRRIASFRREFNLALQPVIWPSANTNAFIQPGMFKGTYHAHGLELVMLSYEDENRITVNKLTGDEDVPPGKLTHFADLSRPIKLDRLQQMELPDLDLPDIVVEVPENRRVLIDRQDFVLPEYWCDFVYPEFCLARFHGRGQIAQTGYVDSSLTDGHWVLFDENTFGFVWLELQYFSMYSRVLGEEIERKQKMLL